MPNSKRLTTWSSSTETPSFLAVATHTNPVLFDKQSYNVPLSGGGGGKSKVLDSNHNVGTFSTAFSNVIYVPHAGYSAYLPTLYALSDQSHTRFGSNSSWQTFTINGGDFNDTSTAFTNAAAGFSGYQTAAFTQYRKPQGSNASNKVRFGMFSIPPVKEKHQTSPPPPVLRSLPVNGSATQYSNQSFTNFSDAIITGNETGKPLNCGFQEPSHGSGASRWRMDPEGSLRTLPMIGKQ